jgi:hypothetical protein
LQTNNIPKSRGGLLGTRINSLKSLIDPSIDNFRKAVCLALIVRIRVILDKEIGPKNSRIGVFGPNPHEDGNVTPRVAKIISEIGYNAITEVGIFRKNSPEQAVNIKDYLPNNFKKISNVVPDQILSYELTHLVHKAVVFENEERGQYYLLKGCFKSKTPTLGLILHNKISNDNQCAFLIDKATFTECGVTEPSMCPRLFKNGFCPFYDSIYVPWFNKEILLSKKSRNRLIAAKDVPDLKKTLQEFLSNGKH